MFVLSRRRSEVITMDLAPLIAVARRASERGENVEMALLNALEGRPTIDVHSLGVREDTIRIGIDAARVIDVDRAEVRKRKMASEQ